jgi:hypothetical protein
MAEHRNTGRDEPQRTTKDDDQIRGVGDQDGDDEFDDMDDLDEDEADEDNSDTI